MQLIAYFQNDDVYNPHDLTYPQMVPPHCAHQPGTTNAHWGSELDIIEARAKKVLKLEAPTRGLAELKALSQQARSAQKRQEDQQKVCLFSKLILKDGFQDIMSTNIHTGGYKDGAGEFWLK